MLRVLDLFSGIGGFSLGLERTGGFRTVAFCEIEPYPRSVLKKHWPATPCYDDIRTLTAERLKADGIAPIDVICGGFPCQDISVAGKGAGLAGERSGLWREYARIIGEIRPKFIIVENVSALLGRGIGRVLGDLSEIGYDAEWQIIAAADVGAPHLRERVWILAYPRHSWICQRGKSCDACAEGRYPRGICGDGVPSRDEEEKPLLAHSDGAFGERDKCAVGGKQEPAHTIVNGWWATEPAVDRVANGIPNRAHRLHGLGNAVVPQIPEIIGRAILKAEGASSP